MPKETKDLDLQNMVWIISNLDMAIYGSPVRLDYIEKILKNYEKKYDEIDSQKALMALKNIEKIMLEKVYTKNLRKRLKILNYGTRIFLISAIIVAFISLFYDLLMLLMIFYSLFILAVIFLFVNYFLLRSIDKIIENFQDGDYLREKEYIKNLNQTLINILIKKIREKNADPRKYTIPLKSKYGNIEIVSRSNTFRKYYMGIVKFQP